MRIDNGPGYRLRIWATVLFVSVALIGIVPHAAAQTPPLWNGGTPTCGSASTDCVGGVPIKPATWPVECGATCGDPLAPAGSWVPYSWGTTYPDSSLADKHPIKDQRVQDPSNGGTTPQNYVNVSSGCPDQTLPSIYYFFDKTADGGNGIVFFRWRVEQIANNYATGPSAGAYSSTDPWSSALWTVLIDTDGNGYRDFAMHLNGSSGAPATPIDNLRTIWSTLTSNSIDYIGDATNIHSLFSNPTAFATATNGALYQFNGSGLPTAIQWPNGSSETNWDYGTTRSINISTNSCIEYYVDYQIPLRMLNAAGAGGPTMKTYTPFQFLFATANSLNNPFQKDIVWDGNFVCDASSPGPFGDAVTLDGGIIPQPIVTKIAAGSPTNACIVPVTAQIMDALTVNNCQSISQLVSAQFKYYYDTNGNGQDDDGGTWTNIGNATTPVATTVTANWDISNLIQGQYLLALELTDTRGHTTQTWMGKSSYPVTAPFGTDSNGPGGSTRNLYTNVPPIASIYVNPGGYPYTGLVASGANQTLGVNYQIVQIGGSCGAPPPTVTKTASPSSVQQGGAVTYTLTLSNTSNTVVTVSSITDTLPAGFSYLSTGAGTLGAPSSESGTTGTISWTFPGGTTLPATSTRTFIFTVNAGTGGGTFYNTANILTNVGTLTGTDNTGVSVRTATLTVSKAVTLASDTSTPVTTVNQNDIVQFQMVVTNNSQTTCTNLVVSDPLPAGFTYQSATPAPFSAPSVNTNGTVIWHLSSLALNGGTQTFTINAKATQAGVATNTVTVTSDQTTPATASTSLSVSGPLLSITKTASTAAVVPPGTVDYYIDYANTGNQTANITTLTDTIPTGFTLVTGAPTTSGCTASGSTVTCTINNTLAAGSTANITLRFSVSASAVNPSSDTATINASNATSASATFSEDIQSNSCTNVDYHFRTTTTQVSTSSSNLGVASVTVTAVGTGYANQPGVSASGGGAGSGATATATIAGGVITAINLGAGGSGYSAAAVVIAFTGCTSTPAATATISSGAITGFTITNNGTSGCTAANIAISSGGFTAVAHGSGAGINAIDVINSGTGFTSAPSIVITAVGGGTGASATATTTASALTATQTQGSAATATAAITVNQVQTEFARFYSNVPSTDGSVASGVPDSLVGYIVSSASVNLGWEKISGNKVLSQVVLGDFDPATNSTTTIATATGAGVQPGGGNCCISETYSLTTSNYVLPATHRLVWIVSARDSNASGTSVFKLDYNGTQTFTTSTSYNNNNYDSRGTVCLIPVRISLTKEANKLSVTAAGDTISYTLRYNNPSSITVTNVKVYDPVPTGMTYSSSTPSTGTVSVGTTPCPTASTANCVTWTIGSVAANASGTLTINAAVPST
ncbi:MAG TPA: hypothetical protein VGA84_08455, partial [Thermoanaerobaculia bacterium]